MKKLYIILLYAITSVVTAGNAFSQACQNGTPLFYVDLTGQPNGVWQSPPIQRGGDCCGGSDVNCIEFIVTLDSNATGILFNIVSGALPPGALYYQVNCGPLTSVGQPVCLNGPGPHDITFCKPGNNLNVYEIASIPIPDVTGTEWVSEACTGSMSILGLDSTTTTWTSIPPNPVYNSFLSCMSGCNNVTINPTGTLPAYIDYQVCGYPVGGCYTTPFCDTMRVNLVNTLAVAITPQNPVICYGAPLAIVTANVTGGNDPFNYVWSNGATTQSITVGPGTYYVSVTDSMNCSFANDSVVVSGMSLPISANAGPDQVLCLNNVSAQLNGSVVAATGGIWSGGLGTFTPSVTTLNAVYTPAPSEITNGSVQLTLVTTGNNTCPADTDQVVISITPNPAPAIQGPATVCEFSTSVYSTNYNAGNIYAWNVTGGTVIATASNAITVQWGAQGAGTVTVTETNSLLCDSTTSLNITIAPQPTPVISGPLTTCTTTSSSFSITSPLPGNTYSWNVTGGTITGPANGSSITVNWTSPGTSTVTVTENNSQGCDSTVSVQVTVFTLPAPVIAGPDTVCEMQTVTYTTPFVSGNTYSWNVSGGTILSSANNSITVQWPVAGSGSVSVTETNTITCNSTVTTGIIIAPQPAPAITGPQNVCTTFSDQYSVLTPVPGNTYAWTVSGGTILGATNGTSVNIFWNAPGTGIVTLYESNSLGCDSAVSANVSIYTMPAPVLAGPDTVCEMQTVTYTTPFVSGNNYSWNVTGGTILSSSNNTITVQWPATGSGSVSVTETNTPFCDSTVTTAIIIAPQPAPAITGPQNVCTTFADQFSVLTPVPGNTYAWTVSGGTILGAANGTSVNIFWNMPGTGIVTLYESNSLGCDSAVSANVSIYTMPAPVLAGPDTVCEMQTVTYTTPLVSGNTYNWSVTGGTVISTSANTITVQWPANGTGSVSLTESNTSACDSTVRMNVIIAPQPAPVINGPLNTCTTTSNQFNVVTPVPGNTYSWTVTGGTISGPSNGTSITVQWTTPGSATVTLTESNPLGCDSTVSVTASVMAMPAPVITGPDTVCALHTIVYSTPLVQGNIYTWNVTGGVVVSNNLNSIAVQWPANGSGTVSVTEMNTSTCVVTVSTSIFIAPQPVPVINGSTTSCTSTFSQYTASNTTPGNTYAWSITGGLIIGPSNGTTINVYWNNANLANLSFTESNNFGCDSTVSITINAMQRPEPEISGPPVVCEEMMETYVVPNYVPTDTYFWSVTNGSIIGLNVGSSIEVLWNNPGTGTITLRQVSPNGCDSTTSSMVVINPLPAPAISGPAIACENEPITYFTPMVPGHAFTWSATGGYVIGNNSGSQVVVQWASGVSGNLYLTQTTQNGCYRNTQLPVQILDKPNPSITGNAFGCVSNDIFMYYTLAEPGINYQWSATGGAVISGNGSATAYIQWLVPGNHTITLTAVNAFTGCDSTVAFQVQTGALPTPVIQSPALSGCIPLTTNFSGNVVGANYNYTWNFGDGTTATGPNPSHAYNQPGTYTVQLIATNNTGCADTVTSVINAYPVPVASFNLWHGTGTYYANISNMTLENLSTGGTSYFWTFGDGATSTDFEPIYQYTEPGNYTIALVVANQYGCTDLATTKLEVKLPENIYVPNAFTPNGDNKNDYFTVSSYNIDDFRINIFNRWGHLIYTSSDPYFMWDGKYNGNTVSNGVYVFSVSARGLYGTDFNLTGTVTVVR